MKRSFVQGSLPEGQKRQLCLDLLAEFGARNITERSNGELIHSCCLPIGNHRNGDKNPSASLNYSKLTYMCLGCGNSGGLLWMIAVCRGEDSEQARHWLETATGTEGGTLDLASVLQLIEEICAPRTVIRQPIPRYDPSILDPWRHGMFHPYLTDGVPEMGVEGRGIPGETLRHFDVGYDTRTDRITIPVWWKGSLVGWQARRVCDADEPKYKSSPELPKSQILFNYQRSPHYLVVESPFSVLRHWHHQPLMTATFGAEVTAGQQRLLHNADRVVLWFDNDKAGWKATRDVGDALVAYTSVFAVDNPYDADPADLPDPVVDRLVEAAIPYAVWKPPSELQRWRS